MPELKLSDQTVTTMFLTDLKDRSSRAFTEKRLWWPCHSLQHTCGAHCTNMGCISVRSFWLANTVAHVMYSLSEKLSVGIMPPELCSGAPVRFMEVMPTIGSGPEILFLGDLECWECMTSHTVWLRSKHHGLLERIFDKAVHIVPHILKGALSPNRTWLV